MIIALLSIKSVFPDGSVNTQNYFCINLYTFMKTGADIWSPLRQQAILLVANQFLTPQTTGIFRGQADQESISNNFGSVINFTQPIDWPFERYAAAMGGDPATGRPGVYGAITQGGSVGAVRDVVLAVTGYTMSDEDFRLTQGVGWQLGQGRVDDCHVTANYNGFLTLPAPVYITVDGHTGGADTFSWMIGVTGATGATAGTGRRIVTGQMELPNWVFLSFDHVSGHAIGDQWHATIGVDEHITGTTFTAASTYRYRYSGNPALPVLDMDPQLINTPHYYLPYNRFSYVFEDPALVPSPTTVIGGNGAVTHLPFYIPGLMAWQHPTTLIFADTISIDGETHTRLWASDEYLVRGWYTGYYPELYADDIAAAMQANIRAIGATYGFGIGWTQATVRFDIIGNKYILASGNSGPGVISITGGNNNPYEISAKLSDNTRQRYIPGIPSGYAAPTHIEVLVNGTPWPVEKWYAKTGADGRTSIWFTGVVFEDVITINYTTTLGDNKTTSVAVPYITGLSPIVKLQSGIYQAYVMLLNVVHDGFEVIDETVVRQLEGNTDYLRYNWLNPWGVSSTYLPPDKEWRHQTVVAGATGAHTVPLDNVPLVGSEFVAVNGSYLAPSQYFYASPTVIELNPDLEVTEGDVIQVDYRMTGDAQWAHEEIAPAAAYPYIIDLPVSPAPVPYGMTVMVNGVPLQAIDYAVDGGQITIPAADIATGDRICVRYYVSGLNTFAEIDHVGVRQDFVFQYPVDPESIVVRVNGLRLPHESFTLMNPTTVRLNLDVYSTLQSTDTIAMLADVGTPAGYSVLIKQGNRVYAQGTHFKVDYTYGKIIWQGVQLNPGTSYQVSYTYFPKQILENLINQVKPATMRVLLQFSTTNGLIFNPYKWDGRDNPSGEVILP